MDPPVDDADQAELAAVRFRQPKPMAVAVTDRDLKVG
jgi:hypothetical protein